MTDINDLLDEIDRRLFDLQTYLSSDDGLGNHTFNQIVIISGSTTYTIDTVVSAPTALTITPGTFIDRIYADVGWTAPVDGTSVSYDVEWAKRNGAGPYTYELVDSKRTSGNSIRLDNLLPHQWYGARVYSINHLGIRSAVPASGFQDFQTSGDSSVPGSPSGLTVFAAIRSLIATWNDNIESDVTFGAGTYRVQVSTNAGFTGVIKDEVVAGTIATFVDLTAATAYYVRIAAIDSSGNQSPWSAGVTNTTGQVGLGDMAVNSVGANQIIANSIVSSHIATVGLDAGTIKFGTLDGNLATIIHLKANNIDTGSITTSTITLNGGALQAGSPPTTGLLINSQGMRLYSGGVAVIIFDAPSGSATLAGNITSTATITGGTLTGATVVGGTVRTAVVGNSSGWIELGQSNVTTIWMHAGNSLDTSTNSPRLSSTWFGYGASAQIQSITIQTGYPTGASSTYGSTSIELDSRSSANDATAAVIINTDAMTITASAVGTTFNGVLRANSEILAEAGSSHFARMVLNDNYIRFRSASDANNRMYYSTAEGTPSNGSQTMDGPMMYGGNSSGMGGSSVYGMLLRASSFSSSPRLDSYVNHHFQNGVYVDGGVKGFLIDHPVKGEKYHLLFSSVESPHADLTFRGVARLDHSGGAEVDIDEAYGLTDGTFNALCRADTRQVFLFNQDGEKNPKGKLNGSKLTISAEPNASVGWLVIGERTDKALRGNDECDATGRLINERKRTSTELEAKSKRFGPKLSAAQKRELASAA